MPFNSETASSMVVALAVVRAVSSAMWFSGFSRYEGARHGEIFNAIVNGNYRTPKGSAGG